MRDTVLSERLDLSDAEVWDGLLRKMAQMIAMRHDRFAGRPVPSFELAKFFTPWGFKVFRVRLRIRAARARVQAAVDAVPTMVGHTTQGGKR